MKLLYIGENFSFFNEKKQYLTTELVSFGISKDYTFNMPSMGALDKFQEYAEANFKNIEAHDEHTVVLIDGISSTTGISLVVLEKVKHKKIDIIYFKQKISSLTNSEKEVYYETYNAFQEMTRSGLFNSMTIIDNSKLEDYILNNSSTLESFRDNLENFTIDIVNNLVWILGQPKPLFGKIINYSNINRIQTLNLLMTDLKEEIELCSAEFIENNEKQFYFLLNEDMYKNNKTLIKEVLEIVNNQDSKFKTSHGMFKTKNLNVIYHFIIKKTNLIQI
jgi:hypothetical protein